LRGPI